MRTEHGGHHGDTLVDEIAGGATLRRLRVERLTGRDKEAHVGDVHAHLRTRRRDARLRMHIASPPRDGMPRGALTSYRPGAISFA